jgi:hypothetical protein
MIGRFTDSSFLDKHPDVPKEYIKNEITRLRTVLDKYKLYRGSRTLDIKEKMLFS